MKKLYVLILAVIGMGLTSCADYLDSDYIFNDRESIEKVFTDHDKTEQWLAHAYSFLRNDQSLDVGSKRATPFVFDDCMYYGDDDKTINSARGDDKISYNKFHEGNYDEGAFQGTWDDCYKGIRQATIFIQNVDMNKTYTPDEIIDFKAQARFVRAYFYWILLRKYGPIPLAPEDGFDYNDSYNDVATPRSSYDVCANHIASEMILAAKDLPLLRGQNSSNRPTRGAALAARALALLYAASPMNNPGGPNDPIPGERFSDLVDDKGSSLMGQEYDEMKWAKAAAACKDIIALGEAGIYKLYTTGAITEGTPEIPDHPEYSKKDFPEGWANINPYESYRSVFNGQLTTTGNPELIFTRGQNVSGEGPMAFVVHQLPKVGPGGWNTHGMTQKQVDTYYMNDGTDCEGIYSEYASYPAYNGRADARPRTTGFTENSTDHRPLETGVSLQYADREPRFYASVAYNGSHWYLGNEILPENRNKQVFYYRGESNGYQNTEFYLRTGIGIKKYIHDNDTNTEAAGGNRILYKDEPAIRYADILLMYAEALNELSPSASYEVPSWDGASTYTVKRDVEEMRKGIKPVRMRAGVPDYDINTYNDQAKFRLKLKRERQIELFAEGKRYYDLRRWKDAEGEEAVPIYGCNYLMNKGQRDLFHTPIAISNLSSTFSRKMYFWSIKHSELKRNKRLTQNPGWTYND